MEIAALIGVMIAIVAGVNLIRPLTSTVNDVATSTITTTIASGAVTTTPAVSSGVQGMMNVLPIIMVAVILLGAVAFMGGGGSLLGFHHTIDPIEDLRKKLIRISKNLKEYYNNLDITIGINTVSDGEAGRHYGLSLADDNKLYVDEKYHWIITDKNPSLPMFKIVGINKSDVNDCKVYVLGKNEKTGKPYLFEVTTKIDWKLANNIDDQIKILQEDKEWMQR